jgi:hypothetical protein
VSESDDPKEELSILDRLRGSGVGMEDPNIIGDAGPMDVAPGQDPPLPVLDEELPPEVETPSERLLPSDELLFPDELPSEEDAAEGPTG